MVINNDFRPVGGDELLARAKLCAKLLDAIKEIETASGLIADGKYWEAYKATSQIEFMVSEVSCDLHGIDLASGGEP